MKLIQLSTLELEDKIDQEIELNPALENKNDAEDLQDYNIDSSNDIKDEEWDFIINNNSTLEDLYKRLDKIITKINE